MLRPQLADSIAIQDLPSYIQNDAWHASQKVDGHRKLVVVDDGVVAPLGRSGQKTDLPKAIVAEFAAVKGHFAFDGELVGQVFWLFDLPVAGDAITVSTAYSQRRDALEGLFAAWNPGERIQLLRRARTTVEKATLVHKLIQSNAEGVMLNHVDARYLPGFRSHQVLKGKFVKDVDCVVTELRRGGKDNIVVSLYADGELVEVADCTALSGDGGICQVGDVVAVQVLYATNDNRLYQPTRPRRRTDKAPTECTIDQLDAIRVNKEVLA